MIFQIAIKNLFLHGKRHFLTSLGLAAGLLGIIFFGGYVLRMEDYLSTHAIYLKNAGHLTINKAYALDKYLQAPSKYSLNTEEQKQIQAILQTLASSLELEKIILSGSTQAMLTNGCQSFPVIVQGIAPDDQDWINKHPEVKKHIPELIKMTEGVDFSLSDSMLASNISPTLWNFFNKVSFSQAKVQNDTFDSLTKNNSNVQNCDLSTPDFQIYSQDFWGGLGLVDVSIVGLKYSGFSFNDEVFLQLKHQQFQNLVKSDGVYKASVFLKNKNNLSSKINLLQSKLNESKLKNIEIHSYDEIKISPIYRGSMNFVTILLIFFIVLICGVVALTIANSIQIAFIERKKDIAVYKSIGFRNSVIQQIFQWEYFILSMLTSIITLILGLLIIKFINNLNIRFQLPGYSATLQFLLEPTTSYLIFTVILIVVMVLLATKWQLNRLLQKQSIELMRFDS